MIRTAFRINLPFTGPAGVGVQLGNVQGDELFARSRGFIFIKKDNGRVIAVKTAPRRRRSGGRRATGSEKLMQQMMPLIMLKMAGGH